MLCAVFITGGNSCSEIGLWGFFLLFFFYFKESDWGASWTAHNETARCNNVTVQHNLTTRNLTDTQWTRNIRHCHPLTVSKHRSSETVVGPMLELAEQSLCPHHEVKLTFMKLTKVTGWLSVCWYGFTRQYCSVLLLLQTWCVLFSLPARQGWNAWKRHYCALTWPTVNGWVKVQFEMYVISKKKEKSTTQPRPCIMFHTAGLQSTVPQKNKPPTSVACCQLTV